MGETAGVVLITGTRKGLGRYLAEQFVQRGYHVVGCSRQPPTETLSNYEHHCLDVSDEKAVKELFFALKKTHGRLDVLINNAGIASMNHSMLTPIDTVRKIFETNVIGTFLFCQEAARLMMLKRSGRIVNFSTVAAPLKLEGESAYAASKAAVSNLTQVLAREFAPYGITVNAIGPTPIRTDLIRGVPEDKLDDLLQRQAIKRFGSPADVYNVIDFFVRPESEFITGQIIYLGGV